MKNPSPRWTELVKVSTLRSLFGCRSCLSSLKMKQIKLLNWNTRGLGSIEKCSGVRSTIRLARCDIVCIQESKLNEFDSNYFLSFLPSFFEKQCVFINAINTLGRCLISWRRNYTPLNSWTTRHTCSVVLRQDNSGKILQ